jgi:putative ABC transport system substrate-binding protein
MRRRDFLGLVGGVAAWPLAARAQAARTRPLIGILGGAGRTTAKPQLDAFFEGLRALGYVQGRDFDSQDRWTDGHNERLPQLAKELFGLERDVIFANPTPAVVAITAMSKTIPIVCFMLADEIRLGLVASDARPGGNVTGLLMRVDGMAGKQVELANEIAPAARRAGIILNPTSSDASAQRNEAEAAARHRQIEPIFAEARSANEVDNALKQLAGDHVDVGIVLYDALFFTNRGRIAEFAASARLPMVYSARDHVDAGGLISYGVSLRANAGRAATYVDKILKGEKPGDLPIEFPTTLELVVNLKTARALGLTVPPTLLARADEVIE